MLLSKFLSLVCQSCCLRTSNLSAFCFALPRAPASRPSMLLPASGASSAPPPISSAAAPPTAWISRSALSRALAGPTPPSRSQPSLVSARSQTSAPAAPSAPTQSTSTPYLLLLVQHLDALDPRLEWLVLLLPLNQKLLQPLNLFVLRFESSFQIVRPLHFGLERLELASSDAYLLFFRLHFAFQRLDFLKVRLNLFYVLSLNLIPLWTLPLMILHLLLRLL